LRRWMRARGFGPVEMAARVGADHGQISRLLSGRQRPGLDLAFAIERATGVDAEEWVVR